MEFAKHNPMEFCQRQNSNANKKSPEGLFLLATSPRGIALHSQTSMFAHFGPRFNPGGALPVSLTSLLLGGLNRSIPPKA